MKNVKKIICLMLSFLLAASLFGGAMGFAVSAEDSCIAMHEAVLPENGRWVLAAGENAQIDLSRLFTDTDGHALSYGFSVTDSEGRPYSNAQIHMSDNAATAGVFTFTTPLAGSYTVEVFAQCAAGGERKAAVIHAEVAAVADGLPVQYGYDETPAGSVTVFATVSSDGIPLMGNDENLTTLSHLQVTVPYFDLAAYGLQDYYRYAADSSGSYIGNTVIQRPTAMHLFIYLIQRYYMGLPERYCGPGGGNDVTYLGQPTNPCMWDEVVDVFNMNSAAAYTDNGTALEYTGGAQSTYMKQVWGHDENLMYYRNHVYPLQSAGWGSTADYILLSDGDTIDMAMFTNWNFYQYGSFCTFVDRDASLEDGELNGNHTDINYRPGTAFSAETGTAKTFSAVRFGTQSVAEGGTDSFESIEGDAHASGLNVAVYDDRWEDVSETAAITDWTDDGRGHYTVTFAKPGTYYLLGVDAAAGTNDACIAPATAKIVVTEAEPEILPGDVNGDGRLNARDVQRLRNYLEGAVELTAEQQLAADVNGDGKLNARDVQRLQNDLESSIENR